MNLLKFSRHLEKSFRYPYKKYRSIFNHLIDKLNTRQIVEISGLRRTGKTTLLFQVINDLIDQNYSPFDLWYCTFDEETPKLEELFESFS